MNASGGNLAHRDLLLALHWIRENIAAFGGDPARIVLVGHGTGAVLANFLLISPLAKGLFARTVLLSGSALSPWATVHNAESVRRNVAYQTGCAVSDSDDIASCLRTKPLQTLLDVRLDTPRFMPRFAPTLPIDEYTPDPGYAMEHATQMFLSRQLMIGVCTTESYADFGADDIQYGLEEDQRNRVLRTYVRNAYVYHLNEIFSAVRNEYTDWDKPIQHPINIRDSTMEALSDGHTVAPLVRVGYLHASHGANTYFFHFGYQTKESDYPQRLGSIRGEDLWYLLGAPLVAGSPYFPHNYSRQDLGVAETLLGLLANFAKSGDPNEQRPRKDTRNDRTRFHGFLWDPYETDSQLYLSVTAKPKMRSHYRGHKMALWLNLIPQLHQPGDEDVSMRHHHFHEREQFYYAGAVRPESFSRLPPPIHPNSLAAEIECEPSYSIDNKMLAVNVTDEEDIELLQHLTTRQYYSYTAALGITVGVGCLLLIINIFIFAGIFYQRDKDRKRGRCQKAGSCSPSSESIPLSTRPQSSAESGSKQQSPDAHVIKVHELPPCYNSLPRGKPERPNPPARTCSNLSSNVKKRLQVQEISV